MNDAIARLMETHWLVFETRFDRDYPYRIVAGCHCGFQADTAADEGYGDTVVEHLLTVAYATN